MKYNPYAVLQSEQKCLCSGNTTSPSLHTDCFTETLLCSRHQKTQDCCKTAELRVWWIEMPCTTITFWFSYVGRAILLCPFPNRAPTGLNRKLVITVTLCHKRCITMIAQVKSIKACEVSVLTAERGETLGSARSSKCAFRLYMKWKSGALRIHANKQ